MSGRRGEERRRRRKKRRGRSRGRKKKRGERWTGGGMRMRERAVNVRSPRWKVRPLFFASSVFLVVRFFPSDSYPNSLVTVPQALHVVLIASYHGLDPRRPTTSLALLLGPLPQDCRNWGLADWRIGGGPKVGQLPAATLRCHGRWWHDSLGWGRWCQNKVLGWGEFCSFVVPS
jgi:hypothetical protein